jgi:DnaJ family protein C protein 7
VRQLEQAREAGNAAFKSGKFQEAFEFYSKALAIDSHNPSIGAKLYSNRATALSKMSKYEEAIEDCDKALDLDPKFFKVFLRRADCYMKLEKFEEAVRDYEKAASMDRGNSGKYYETKTVPANVISSSCIIFI